MQWVYEEISCTLEATNMLLVRVLIGKVEQRDRLESLMGSVPVVQDNAAWNCVSWVKEALRKLQADGRAIGTSQLDWKAVRDAAINYVERKKEQHRFDGNGNFNLKKAATFDLLAGVEVVH